MKTKSNYGSVIIPDGLNVPPSLVKILKRTQSLPNCVQLHKRYQVAWEIFGPQITIQLAGQVGMRQQARGFSIIFQKARFE